MSSSLHKSEQEDDMEEDDKPGTSSSLFTRSVSHGSSGNDVELPSVKSRNSSRAKPQADPPQSKRLRILDEDDSDDGSHHASAGSSNVGDDDMETEEQDQQNDEVVDMEENADPDSLPNQDPGVRQGQLSRRSSTAEEDVSTTVQPLRDMRRSIEVSDFATPHVADAIASTSAAAMIPSLSRSLENSSVLADLNRARNSQSRGSEEMFESRRAATPAAGSSSNLDGAPLPKHVDTDVNENAASEEYLQKMQGKQRLMWARKIFFLSTELVFPGFTAYSDSKNRIPEYMGVRVRSSCLMQALLYAESLFFIMWILSFLSTCDILITVLKELHGYLSICLTCLFIIVNILRLRFGLKGNENDEVQYLALFWMTTVIVQIPLFTFIFLTDLFCPVMLAFTVTMDGTMMIFILLESVIGFIHFRCLLRDELNIIRMARRSKEASQSRANLSLLQQQRENEPNAFPGSGILGSGGQAVSPKDNDEYSSSEGDSEKDAPTARQDSMDFRMRIQRLSQERTEMQQNNDSDDDSNSSEQVSSTSDAIRRRTLKAH